jgi:UDP-N-acetylglucosamine 2-epimerase
LIHSKGIVGNSSVAIRECSYLGVPAINIGSRQNRRDRGRNVIDVDHDPKVIGAAIETIWNARERPRDAIYGQGNAGAHIADVLSRVPLTISKTLTY